MSFFQVNGSHANGSSQFEDGSRVVKAGQAIEYVAINATAGAGFQQLAHRTLLCKLLRAGSEIGNRERVAIAVKLPEPFFSFVVKIFVNLCR